MLAALVFPVGARTNMASLERAAAMARSKARKRGAQAVRRASITSVANSGISPTSE